MLMQVKPKGKTPMIDAIRVAAEALRFTEVEATVVLISDGIETCKGDPCAVAEALRNSASNLKIHVVGYGVDAEAIVKAALQICGVSLKASTMEPLKAAS